MPADPSETPPGRRRSVAKQLQDLEAVDLTQLPRGSIVEWPTLVSRCGKRYIPESWLSKKRSRASWISEYGSFIVEVVDGQLGTVSWCCTVNGCEKMFNAISTSSAGVHLNNIHRIFDAQTDEPAAKRPRQSVLEMQVSASNAPILRPTADSFKNLLLSWIIHNDLPFTIVEDPYFRQLLALFNEHLLKSLVPESDTTIRRWIVARFEQEKEDLKTTLASTKYAKHLSFDIWTSPNTYAVIAVNTHFIDTEFSLQSKLLAMIQLHGSHSGDTQATEILRVIRDFDLEMGISHFQCDNVSSNDTCITSLLPELRPTLTTATAIYEEKKQRRIRCVAHIVNLAAKAFIEANNRHWRDDGGQGPIGKLHRIVHYVRRSPQRRDAFTKAAQFREVQPDVLAEFNILLEDDRAILSLLADNDTRWNSVFLMIKRAIKMRDAVDVYCLRSATEWDGLSRDDILTGEEWLALDEIHGVLRPFAVVTKAFEGNRPNLQAVVRALHVLTDGLKEGLHRFTPSQSNEMPPPPTPSRRSLRQPTLPRHLDDFEVDLPSQRSAALSQAGTPVPEPTPSPLPGDSDGARFIRTGIRAAITKLENYLDLLNDTHAYWFAMILHPGYKTRWMDKHLSEVCVDNHVAALKQHFESHYSHYEEDKDQPGQPDPQESHANDSFLTGSDCYSDDDDHDEVSRYLAEKARPVDDPLVWWKNNTKRFPRLSTMAFNYLSIPATSAECERLFSRAKLTVSSQRHSLHVDSINMLQCLKNWVGNGSF